VSASDSTATDTIQRNLVHDVDALIAAIMADAPVEQLVALTERIATASEYWDCIPSPVIAELRDAIDSMRGGQACATISALLAARSELTTPPA
jgi:hypothetical protein